MSLSLQKAIPGALLCACLLPLGSSLYYVSIFLAFLDPTHLPYQHTYNTEHQQNWPFSRPIHLVLLLTQYRDGPFPLPSVFLPCWTLRSFFLYQSASFAKKFSLKSLCKSPSIWYKGDSCMYCNWQWRLFLQSK